MFLKRKQCPYKPGSVPAAWLSPVPVIYLKCESPRTSSVLPSVGVSRAGNPQRRFTWTCSLQWAQHDGHPPPGGLLRHLLTLALPLSFQPNGMAVILFCSNLLSPTTSIFGSGAPYAARTFLLCHCMKRHKRQSRNAAFACKVSGFFLNPQIFIY